MVYLNPRPTEEASSEFYQHPEYLPFSSLSTQPTVTELLYDRLRRYNLRWKRRLVERFSSHGEILDVGCGTGQFLAEMRSAGWQVSGIERDASASQWGRERLDLNIHTGTLASTQLPPATHQIVTMWHVLEHLYDPLTTFRQLQHYLNDQGTLIVAVPNIDSIDARGYGAHWIALDAPRHVNHFCLATLRRLGAAANFDLIWHEQLPLDAFFNTLMSERLAAQCKQSSSSLWPFRLARAGAITVASLLGGTKLFFRRRPRGATIVAVFKRAV